MAELNPAQRTRSTAVVYWWDFIEAIRTAKVFTDAKKPVVRVELVPERNQVVVTSMSPGQLAAITAEASWIELSTEEDAVFELTASAVKRLQTNFESRRVKDMESEDQPLISIELSKDHIFFYDATGLDLHIYRHYVTRAELEAPPSVAKIITAHEDKEEITSGILEPRMMKNIFNACAIIKKHPDFHFLVTEDKWVTTKALTHAGPLRVLSTVMHDDERDGKLEAEPGETPSPELDTDEATRPSDGPRLVVANPPQGVA
ncbi:hypothetical protein [Corynebacterium aurimucosum]|uniref:hypothetical protein n=1 Tax=Corynebacterium aurimucosum TaxID=169292 RepID=UPI00187A791C|nr:hypothetical protein [Corynebacterium aurimucosum]MBE7338105.1 hypothetical protein [Corynebacterium aurimucosum]